MNEPTALIPALPSRALPAPALIAAADEHTRERFFEFFAAQIRNRDTRAAYLQAAHQFFAWCDEHSLELRQIRPLHVAAYIEAKQRELSPPSRKQHLAGLRMLFNWFVRGQVLPTNPALFMKGPKFSRQVGITPILEPQQMRILLDSIEATSRKGPRDRAAIALMVYTFARVSAIVLLRREDYRLMGKRAQLRLQEKRGKEKLVWLHHEAEEFLDRYLEVTQIKDAKAPLFQTLDKLHRLTGQGMSRRDLLRAVKQCCANAGCRRTLRITRSAAPVLPCSCKTAARSKPPRTWPTIPIRAPPSCTTEGRILPRSARLSEELRSEQ